MTHIWEKNEICHTFWNWVFFLNLCWYHTQVKLQNWTSCMQIALSLSCCPNSLNLLFCSRFLSLALSCCHVLALTLSFWSPLSFTLSPLQLSRCLTLLLFAISLSRSSLLAISLSCSLDLRYLPPPHLTSNWPATIPLQRSDGQWQIEKGKQK